MKSDSFAVGGVLVARVSKEAKAQTHERIVVRASRLFREKGVEGISVSDIMAAAKLTHGGFYRHFSSKDELAAAAIGRAIDDTIRKLEEESACLGAEAAVAAYFNRYLSAEHVAAADRGCVIAALASEAARGVSPIREALARGAERIIAALARGISGEPTESRRKATAAFATLVGTLLLARSAGSRRAIDDVLAAGREAVELCVSRTAP
ncbi:MAG: TetR/AcrR family transcriptional regulator [Alphaproteobacteria bacterium]|nr:MAG: TetR/AcrR family transcriptional regulator [Alphaproteobacteria bacterium]